MQPATARIQPSPKLPGSIWKKKKKAHEFIILIDAPFKLDRNKQNSPKASWHFFNNHQLGVNSRRWLWKLLLVAVFSWSLPPSHLSLNIFNTCYDICWRCRQHSSSDFQYCDKNLFRTKPLKHFRWGGMLWSSQQLHIKFITQLLLRLNNIWHCIY